jgi:hypothetical protein
MTEAVLCWYQQLYGKDAYLLFRKCLVIYFGIPFTIERHIYSSSTMVYLPYL